MLAILPVTICKSQVEYNTFYLARVSPVSYHVLRVEAGEVVVFVCFYLP